MRLPVPPRTVHWLAIVLFSALVALLATPAHAQTDVPSNWPLIPSGLNAGDEFRLLLVTKRPMPATSNDISDYDAHVQSIISERGHAHIQAYAGNFKVLGSTATVNVRSHTGTTGTGGVPIYWIRGLRVADDYADFFDGSWANKQQGRYQDSSRISGGNRNRLLCTGTADDGTTTTLPLGGADPDGDGVSECTATTINTTTATLSGRARDTSDSPRYLALSGVFRVAAAPVVLIESVEITSDSGGDKDYEAGDEIEITVTFSEAVAVTGTPRLKIKLNGTRMAEYVGSGSTAADLVFSYTVTDRDYDLDGVSLPSNGLRLNGGTIKSQADGTDALLDLTAVPGGPAYRYVDPPAWEDISPHRVHNRPALTGVGVGPPLTGVSVASNPAVGSSYSTGETILIDVHFDKPMRVITHEGVPTYEITFDGRRRREAHYTEVVWGNTVRFAYEVQSNDYDEDGLTASEGAIRWNGGLITRNGVHDDITLALRAKDDHTALIRQSTHKVNALDTTMAPVIVDAGPFTVSENQTAVATLTATDGDTASADLVWTIEGGADESAFELSTAGVLTFAEAKDYEAPDDADADGAYEVDVMVTDGVNRVVGLFATGALLTVRLADVDETATGPKLTAEWVKFPPGHSGDGRKFTVRVKFSDPVTINARYFRDYALSVTGGAVDKVWRVKGSGGEPRKDLWAIRVTPTSQQPLSLSLAAIQDCSEHGAICTADGTPLSNAASITVTGPNHDLTVADAEVEEGPGAALAFVVTLSGTAPYRVKVDYATSDGTATAGSDYTATSGTLIFERGETSKTISVPVLDDAHDDDSETLTLTLTNPKRGMIVDGEAVGTIRNTDHMPKAWIARFGRTVADQVLDTVEERLRSARTAGMSVSLGGETIGSTTAKAQADGNSGAAPDGKAASLFDGTTADAEEVEQLEGAVGLAQPGQGREGPVRRLVPDADRARAPDGLVVLAGGADRQRRVCRALGPDGADELRRPGGYAEPGRRRDHGPDGRGLCVRALDDGPGGLAQRRRGRLPGRDLGRDRGHGDGGDAVGALRGDGAAVGMGRGGLRRGRVEAHAGDRSGVEDRSRDDAGGGGGAQHADRRRRTEARRGDGCALGADDDGAGVVVGGQPGVGLGGGDAGACWARGLMAAGARRRCAREGGDGDAAPGDRSAP